MNRGSFLKSLATLIAAPSLIGQIKEPTVVNPKLKVMKIGDAWITKAEHEYYKKWYEDMERQIWFGSATKRTI